MSDPSALIEQVARAFAAVPYPGDDALAPDGHSDEPYAVRRAFRGRDRWQDLGSAFLDDAAEGWGTALSFFSAPAFHFYLPAYLVADLSGELSRVEPAYALCWGVEPETAGQRLAQRWGGGTLGDHARRRFAAFDAAQVRAVVAYLWWVLDRDGYEDVLVRHALEAYWLEREGAL